MKKDKKRGKDKRTSEIALPAQENAERIRFLDLPLNAVQLIAIAVVLVYMGTLQAPFVFDDIHTIVKNPYITSFKYVPTYFFKTIKTALLIEHQGWRPVWFLSFAINYMMGGLNPLWFHVTNMLIHFMNCVLIYFIALALLAGRSVKPWLGALLAGLVFAVHPLQTESVSYIVGRSASLAALFYLIAFYLYILYRDKRKTVFIVAACISFCLAVLTKENAVTFPLMAILYDYSVGGKGGKRSKGFKGIAALVLLAVVYTGIRYYITRIDATAMLPRGLAQHWLTEVYVVPLYIIKSIFPVNLNIDPDIRDITSLADPRFFLSFAALALVFHGLRRLYTRDRLAGFLGVWFFVALIPETVLPITDFMAEHRTYLPLVGPAVLFGYYMERIITRWLSRKETMLYAPAAAALIIVTLGAATVERNKVYKSEAALWEDTLRKSPGKARTFMALGVAKWHDGDLDKAEYYMRKAVELQPDYPMPYYNMALVLRDKGRLDEALPYNRKALELMPDDEWFLTGIGVLYFKMGRDEEAVESFGKAIRLKPDYADAHYNLGTLYLRQGKLDAAVKELGAAARLEPHNAMAHNNIGSAYFGMKNYGQAKYEWLEALRYMPQDPHVHLNMANVMAQLGDRRGAAEHYELFLKYAPPGDPDRDKVKKELDRLTSSKATHGG